MSAILTLDLGTQTGWSLLERSGAITSGTLSFKNDRYQGGGMRYLRFSRWLDDIKRFAGPVTEVYFEEVRRHLGVDAAHAYGGFLATLTAWCEKESIPYQGVSVGTLKRHATGKGNASKQEVLESLKAKGYNLADDNEADAIALLEWARSQYKGCYSRA